MKKNSIYTGLIYLVILALYNLVVFMVVKDFNAVFWTNYAFMTGIYLINAGITSVFAAQTKEKSFMNIPLVLYSPIFVGVEFVLSTIFILARNVVSIKLVIVLQAILLGVYIIGIVFSQIGKTAFKERSNNIKSKVVFIQGIAIDIELLIGDCTDDGIKKQLKKLYETVKYSDPMANSFVAREENMISDAVMELKELLDNGDMENVPALIKKLERLFEERNRKILITK